MDRFRRDGVVPKTATEKALVLLRHYLASPVLDPDIKVIRAPLGGVVKISGPELCAETSTYGLDHYPTKWYRHAEGKDGYVPSEHFEKAMKEPSIAKFLTGLNADSYLDRLVVLLNKERGLQMLILMSMLAGREFGVTYVAADVELGLKGFRETSSRGIENVKSVANGRAEIGIAQNKLRMLANADLLRDLRSHFSDRSITDQRIISDIHSLSPSSPQFRLAKAAVDLADSLLEGLTRHEADKQLMLGEEAKPVLPPSNVLDILARLERIMRLGEALNVQPTDVMGARLSMYDKLTSMLYAASNVRCDFKRNLPEGSQDRYFLVADLTDFTGLGTKLVHTRFRDAADEAMNIIYNYGKLFGAFIAKASEGDKAMLGFPSRGQAVAAAAFCFEHFTTIGEALHGEAFFGIKCGLAAGEYSVIVGDDLVGDAINVASRLCSGARAAGSRGGVVASRQMLQEEVAKGKPFMVEIKSSNQVVKEIEAIEVDSAVVCNGILDQLNRLSAEIRKGE